MGYPKILWPSGGSPQSTLLFPWQPLQWTPVHKEAVRHDSIASVGDQQSVLERIENLQVLRMHFVPSSDLTTNWSPFLDSALAGNPFDYFPDRDLGSFVIYYLLDMVIEPQWDYNDPTEAVYRFDLVMRKKLP